MSPRRLDPPPSSTYVRFPDPAYTRGWNDCLLSVMKALNLRVFGTGNGVDGLVLLNRSTRQLIGLGNKREFRYSLSSITEFKTVTQRIDGKFYLGNKLNKAAIQDFKDSEIQREHWEW